MAARAPSCPPETAVCCRSLHSLLLLLLTSRCTAIVVLARLVRFLLLFLHPPPTPALFRMLLAVMFLLNQRGRHAACTVSARKVSCSPSSASPELRHRPCCTLSCIALTITITITTTTTILLYSFYAHPNPMPNHAIASKVLDELGGRANLTGRDHMTLWRSTDQVCRTCYDCNMQMVRAEENVSLGAPLSNIQHRYSCIVSCTV